MQYYGKWIDFYFYFYLILRSSNIFKLLYKFCNILIPGRAEQNNLRAGQEISAQLTSLLLIHMKINSIRCSDCTAGWSRPVVPEPNLVPWAKIFVYILY